MRSQAQDLGRRWMQRGARIGAVLLRAGAPAKAQLVPLPELMHLLSVVSVELPLLALGKELKQAGRQAVASVRSSCTAAAATVQGRLPPWRHTRAPWVSRRPRRGVPCAVGSAAQP